MKRLINRIARLAALVAVVAAAACSKEPTELLPQGGDGVIRLSADVVVAAEDDTRAPVIDGTTAKAVLSDMHFLRKDGETMQTNFGGITALSAARDAEGKITFAGTAPTYDKVNDHNAYLVAYWPTTAANGATVTAGEKVTWTIDGQTDILLSTLTPTASYSAGKFSVPITGTMPLKHALAQVKVIIKAVPTTTASLAAVQDTWGTITKVELTNTAKILTYTYATNAVTQSSDVALLSLLKPDYSAAVDAITIPAASTSVVAAAGMYAPLASGVLQLWIRNSKSSTGTLVNVQLKNAQGANCAFEAGKSYTVTLAFGANDKEITVAGTAVTPWAYGGAGSSDQVTSERIYLPSEGVLDMRYNGLVKSDVAYSITSTRKSYNTYTYNASNADNNGGYLGAREDAYPEPAYYKLEVAKADETNTMNWTDGWNACKAKAPAGAWRLPRASELALMKVNKAELEKSPDFTPFLDQAYYWSGSESVLSSAWHIQFPSTILQHTIKNAGSYVRCVRELIIPAVEDYYYADGTFSRDLDASKSVEGVIYWVDFANPRHFKIVSMDEPPANWEGGVNLVGRHHWALEHNITGATSMTGGKANTLKLMQRNLTEYPAAKWCYTKNTELSGTAASSVTTATPGYQWYLPARTELQHLFCAYRGVAPTTWSGGAVEAPAAAASYPAAWNARFPAGVGAEFTAYRHWSSTEAADDMQVCSLYENFAGDGATIKDDKHARYFTRCIREITLPQ